MKNLRATFFLIICLPIFLRSQAPKELEDQAIIDRVRATYASLPYYIDSTVVCIENRSTNPCGIDFSSTFIRSSFFEIKGRKSTFHADVWIKAGVYINLEQNQSLAWVHRGNSPVEIDTRNLNIGIARLVATFSSAAKIIPSLLLPDSLSGLNRFQEYAKISHLEEEILRGEDCYVIGLDYPIREHSDTNPIPGIIEAIPPSTSEYDLKCWIRKSDFRILKYEEVLKRNGRLHKFIVHIFPQPTRVEKLKPSSFIYH